MAVAPITDHVAQAVSRLLSSYQSQPLVVGFVSALVRQLQLLENAGQKMFTTLSLANLHGAALDAYGELVGVARGNLDDDSYRSLLAGTIGANYSDGQQEVLLDALALLFRSNLIYKKSASSIAQAGGAGASGAVLAYGIGSPAITADMYPTALSTFQKAIPAGIGVFYLSTFLVEGAFSFDGPQSWVRGFGDANDPTVGGKLANVIYVDPRL